MDPFLGSLMCVSFPFAPKGWAACNGQLLPINQNQALFSLLGTSFGGDGRTTFALPNLQGRAPIGVGANFQLGQVGGEEGHTLTPGEMPLHTHTWAGTASAATLNAGAGNVISGAAVYNTGGAGAAMNPLELGSTGGGQPHENRSPSTAMLWVIALQGIFPARN